MKMTMLIMSTAASEASPDKMQGLVLCLIVGHLGKSGEKNLKFK